MKYIKEHKIDDLVTSNYTEILVNFWEFRKRTYLGVLLVEHTNSSCW